MSLPNWTLLPADAVPCPPDCKKSTLCFWCNPKRLELEPVDEEAAALRADARRLMQRLAAGEVALVDEAALRSYQTDLPWDRFQQHAGQQLMLRLHDPDDEGETHERD